MASAAERLAREISELRRRLEGLERAAATELRSIDDGSLSAFDEDGNEKVVMGRQPDGSYGLQGFNGGQVVADTARENAITADAILDGAVGPEKTSFYGEIQDAATSASEAQDAAEAAQADATAAAQDAAIAQAAADDAEASALEALGVAGSKSEIVFQATAPAGDPNVFWVDTDTDRGHRWDGSQWQPIQDVEIQAALSDAAQAQSDADAAQGAASTAQTAAESAQQSAEAAQATADDAEAAAAAAQATADAAESAAAAADAKAVAAQSDANAAQSAADAAQADATAAQSAANDAEQQALDALGVANSKADIVYASTAPAGSAEIYWVDTDTGRGNRWDGSRWVEIQDEEIQTALSDAAAADSKAQAAQEDATQAAAAAAAAQDDATAAQSAASAAQSAADAAQSAADAAQGTADQAVTDAAQAQSAANAAQTAADAAQAAADDAEADALDALGVANSKADIVYAATAPTGDPNLYWVNTTTGRGNRWNGSAWVEIQDEEIQDALSQASSAQSAADAAQADANAAQTAADDAAAAAASAQSRADDAYVLADGKVQSFWGVTDPSTTDTLGVGDLWLDEGNGNVLKRWNGSAWDVVQDEEIQTALQNASEAQATADGKITTFVGSSAPTAEGVGDFWVDAGNGNLLKRWDGTGWVPLQVDTGAIAPQAVTETEVSDGAISTPKLQANAVSADKLEAILVIVNRIVAGNPNGARTEMNATGIQSYDTTGTRTFEADEDGNVFLSGAIESTNYSETTSGWRLDDQDAQVPNLNVLDTVGAETVSGQRILVAGDDLDEVLSGKPDGLVAYGEMPGGSDSVGSTGERAWGALTVSEPKYMHYYRITYSAWIRDANPGEVINFRVRFNKDGGGPTPGNTGVLWNSGQRVQTGGADGIWRGPTVTHSFVYKETTQNVGALNLLFTSWKEFGSGQYLLVNQNEFGPHVAVEHLGPASMVEQNLRQRWAKDGSSNDSGTDSKSTYTKTWTATWGNSYDGDGSTYSGDNGNLYQGYYSGTHGNTRSMVGFDDASIRSALSGATIKKVTYTFRVRHDYYNSGLDVVVGHHNNSGSPGSWNAGGYADRIGRFDSLKAGGTYTVNLAQDWVGNGFRDGTIRGLTFGPGSGTNRNFYGYMYGANTGSPPKLHITYEK